MTILPEEFIALPINGEPTMTKNNKAINQDWCKHEMIKEIDEFYGQKRPIGF